MAELESIKAAVLPQQAKVLVPFQLELVKYADWEPHQRAAFLQQLGNTVQSFCR